MRLYDRLLSTEDPGAAGEDDAFMAAINPDSLQVLTGCKVEPGLAAASPGAFFQFERLGYFCADLRDSSPDAPVFNRTVGLRDAWTKAQGVARAAPRG